MNRFGSFLLTKKSSKYGKNDQKSDQKVLRFFKSASKWIYLRQNKVFLNPHLGGFGYPNYVVDSPFFGRIKKTLVCEL